MAKPTSLPRWGETAGGVPGSNEVEPTEGKKDTGYGIGGDIPTSGGLNWWMRLVYKWVEWVNAAASLATASVLVVRDAAGRARFADPSDNADADTKGARDTAITTHNGVTNPHSATAAATADRLMLRDANGRAKVADGSAADDIVTVGQAITPSSGTVTDSTGFTFNTTLGWCKKVGKMVSLRFVSSASAAGGAWSSIGTLPAGFRPAVTMSFVAGTQLDPGGASYSARPAAFTINASTGVVSLEKVLSAGVYADPPGVAYGDADSCYFDVSFPVP